MTRDTLWEKIQNRKGVSEAFGGAPVPNRIRPLPGAKTVLFFGRVRSFNEIVQGTACF